VSELEVDRDGAERLAATAAQRTQVKEQLAHGAPPLRSALQHGPRNGSGITSVRNVFFVMRTASCRSSRCGCALRDIPAEIPAKRPAIASLRVNLGGRHEGCGVCTAEAAAVIVERSC
jgi:hypothetical protein